MSKIYGVTGMPLSGKTTVAKIMENKLEYNVLDMGDIVRIEMDKRDIPTEDTGKFVGRMRDQHGGEAIAKLSAPYLEEMKEEKEKIVITGMRGWNEKEYFEEEIGKEIDMIAVWASRKTRKERRDERERAEDVKGDGFHERDLREIDQGVGKLLSLSDSLIQNDGIELEELEQEVEENVR